jgi:hypothetical protein
MMVGLLAGAIEITAPVGGHGGNVLATVSSSRRDGENEASLTPLIVMSSMNWREFRLPMQSGGVLYSAIVDGLLEDFFDNQLSSSWCTTGLLDCASPLN